MLFRASPGLGALVAIQVLLPDFARRFLMYRVTGRWKGQLRIERLTIATDLFHALQWIDTFYFDALERFPEYKLSEGLTVIDIGAHHGMYSLKAGLRRAKRVVAIEPDPQNFKILEGNISRANSRNILALNIAVSGGAPEVALFEGLSSGGHTTSAEIKRLSCETYTSRRSVVKALSLDSLIRDLDLVPDLIKIDTQGAEVDILRGARKTLETRGIRFVIDTHGVRLAREVESLLVRAGFIIEREKETIYALHQS